MSGPALHREKNWRPGAVIAMGLLLFSATASLPAAEGPYQVGVQRDVMVAMRDGARLATDVYLPTKDGKPLAERLPTILMRTPYSKGPGDKGHGDALYFARHGYAVVFQDTRGRYRSEGVWHWLADDGPDGFDTAEWIARQGWSNGKIGMLGTSYVGGTQHALAMTKNPHLATVIPVDAVCNQGYASMRNGGAFELRFWNWIMLNAGRGSRQARDPATAAILREMADHRVAYLLNLPLRRGTTPLKHAPEYEDWLVEAMSRGANDAFWSQNNVIDHADRYDRQLAPFTTRCSNGSASRNTSRCLRRGHQPRPAGRGRGARRAAPPRGRGP